jgi:hypothetical protein
MQLGRLLCILDDWAKWMKKDSHRLGFPTKSSFLSSGGESSHDAFEEMINKADKHNVITVNAVVNSLPKAQRQAIYARYLKDKKPMYYEKHLELAIDNLLIMVGKRIDV